MQASVCSCSYVQPMDQLSYLLFSHGSLCNQSVILYNDWLLQGQNVYQDFVFHVSFRVSFNTNFTVFYLAIL
uniref:Uncharacterized protein n=1 Tax=Rhizophora mucronata TaxID=61149 RepID=A0A2P2P0U2_RHIMU